MLYNYILLSKQRRSNRVRSSVMKLARFVSFQWETHRRTLGDGVERLQGAAELSSLILPKLEKKAPCVLGPATVPWSSLVRHLLPGSMGFSAIDCILMRGERFLGKSTTTQSQHLTHRRTLHRRNTHISDQKEKYITTIKSWKKTWAFPKTATYVYRRLRNFLTSGFETELQLWRNKQQTAEVWMKSARISVSASTCSSW